MATDCLSSTSRLFVGDQVTKHRFLVGVGSDLCCFQKQLFRDRRPGTDFQLIATNKSLIKTYGFLGINLNLGLRRQFVWRFIIAHASTLILGSDFLAYYNLLPDCCNKRLIDATTNKSVAASLRHST